MCTLIRIDAARSSCPLLIGGSWQFLLALLDESWLFLPALLKESWLFAGSAQGL